MTTDSLVLNFHRRDFISLIIFPVTSSRVKKMWGKSKESLMKVFWLTQPQDLTVAHDYSQHYPILFVLNFDSGNSLTNKNAFQ